MACGCGKKGSALRTAQQVNAEPYQIMAYTGKRIGTTSFHAEGTKKYNLGNSSFTQQTRISPADFFKIKDKYKNQVMIIPGDLERVYLPDLGEPIANVEVLADYLMGLEDLEIETVGEVIATEKSILRGIMGDATDAVVAALRLRVGLEQQIYA